jgi:hypothetical protein
MQTVEGVDRSGLVRNSATDPLVRTISLAELERERTAVAKVVRAKAIAECEAIARSYMHYELSNPAEWIAYDIATLKDVP